MTTKAEQLERLRQQTAAALERYTRHKTALATLAQLRPEPWPGDCYDLPLQTELMVDWLVVRTHPDDAATVLLVPITEWCETDAVDVTVPGNQYRPYITYARCGWSVWCSVGLLTPERRGDWVEAGTVDRVRKTLAALARGEVHGGFCPSEEYAEEMERVARAVAEVEELNAKEHPQ